MLLGTAGALDDDLAIGDVAVATEINEYLANGVDPKSETRETRDSSLTEDGCPINHPVNSVGNSSLRRFAGFWRARR